MLRLVPLGTPDTAPLHALTVWAAVCAGRLPAEVLATTTARERLVRMLHTAGWSDTQIAVHTRWSTYTVTRIRERIGLPANACQPVVSGVKHSPSARETTRPGGVAA